jgi:hypothetical protein
LSPEQYELINKQIQESIEKFNLEKQWLNKQQYIS